MTPHVHADIIKAWADGHTLQFRPFPVSAGKEWRDCNHYVTPAFDVRTEYRVKPAPQFVTREYHFYLGRGTPSLVVTEEYPPNVRFTFEAGKLIDVELIGNV